MKTNEIRKKYLEFFENKGHKIEESASLIPVNDPTLLWINAGIAPLKKYFDGSVKPESNRLTNAQKCIRTNDIENVGVTARHHTFFEMLGNFSIGDYFRNEAIEYGYELLTSDRYFNIPVSKLYITYYPDDIETKDKWISFGIPEERLIPTSYNFWEIGSGPCGACTEIFYDRGEKYGDLEPVKTIGEDIENDRFIEIWNIVFSQYNSEEGKDRSEYKELPNKNIDTGMGLERMACILQDVETNFETDGFMYLINEIEKISNVKYEGQMSFKVIADHIRTVSFAIADGAVLSNEGRGYVLRRLLRRAVKHGKKLGITDKFMVKVSKKVVESMSVYYNILKKNEEIIYKVIDIEEEKFLQTINDGEKKLIELISKSSNKIISGKDAFLLYDTYGFPIELTEEYAQEHCMDVNIEEFNDEMEKQKERARNARGSNASMTKQRDDFMSFTEESKFDYLKESVFTEVIGVFPEGIVVKETCMYALSGGQVSDKGTIDGINVDDVIKMPNGQHLHVLTGKFSVGQKVNVIVDKEYRQNVTINHSATHLLYSALRKEIGEHVSQQGSNVSQQLLRFDFNNYETIKDEDILKIENNVKSLINKDYKTSIKTCSIEEAKEMGAIAEFGEKYSSNVRVVDLGSTIDLCGGTHIANLNMIKDFAVLGFESKGSGIYRITGCANDKILDEVKNAVSNTEKDILTLVEKANGIVKEASRNNINLKFDFKMSEEYINSYTMILKRREELKQAQDALKNLTKKFNSENSKNALKDLDKFESEIENNNLITIVEDIDSKLVKDLVDALHNKYNLSTVFLANKIGDKLNFCAKSNDSNVHCGNLVKEAAVICGGNGGGRPDYAQAGGKDSSKLDEAIKKVKGIL